MEQMTAEQLAEIKATCVANVSTATRQVTGGYIVTGQIIWARDGNPVAVQKDEAVCVDKSELGSYIYRYYLRQTFTAEPELPFERTFEGIQR